MKKDIQFLPVEGVCIGIARKKTELNEITWNVYLINKNSYSLDNVVIRSKGYGTKEEQKQETSTLIHHIPELKGNDNAFIELIDPSVFHLYNEYWISYFVEGQVFDKKFIFVPDSIIDAHIIPIPQLEAEGILHS